MIRTFLFEGKDRITLPARVEAFEMLQKWLAQMAGELQLPKDTARKLYVVADEIFTNIASYGYPQKEGTAEVSVSMDTDSQILQLTFIDQGIPCNPLEVAATPDTTAPAEERRPGGLGLFLVKNLMDTVEYTRDDGKNILRMTKKIGE